MKVQGSSVLITGAARGLGRALVDLFAARNWVIFPMVRSSESAQKLRDSYPGQCFPIVTDLRDAALEDRVSGVLDQHTSHLDLLINNAGVASKKRGLMQAVAEDILSHFNVHCIGPLRCIRAALPFLKASRNPRVINISSRWSSLAVTASGRGWFGDGPIYAYKMAKCAQNMLTASLDAELRDHGIRVFAVHPGKIRTRLAAPDADMEPDQAARQLVDWIDALKADTPCGLYDVANNTKIEW